MGRRAGRGSSPLVPTDAQGCSFPPSLQMNGSVAHAAVVTGEQPTGPGDHSLVGGVAVTDHLGQDPLLIPVHGLHPGGHLVSRFGHVVPRSRNGPAEGRGSEDGIKMFSPSPRLASPYPARGPPSLVTRLPDPQGQGHG